MIEVDYNKDLESNIETANSEFDSSDVHRKVAPFAVIAVASVAAMFGFDIIPADALNIACAIGGFSVLYTGGTYIANTISKRQHFKNVENIENDLSNLASKLNNDLSVNVTKENLKEAISVDIESTQTRREVYESNTTSNIEKIVKYFYLLDESDQIRVLEQIATDKNNNNVIEDTEYETFMLEEKDLIGHKYPVRKMLCRK